jgi:hypothetical protein
VLVGNVRKVSDWVDATAASTAATAFSTAFATFAAFSTRNAQIFFDRFDMGKDFI